MTDLSKIKSSQIKPKKVAKGKKNRRLRRTGSLAPLMALTPFLKKYPAMLTGLVISIILASIATLSLPAAMRYLIDSGLSNEATSQMNTTFICLFFIGVLLALSSSARYYCVNWIGERLVADLREGVFSHLARLSPKFFDQNHSGELMSRLASDATLINMAVRASVSQALRNIMLLLGALVMMFVTSTKLSLLVLGAIPLVVIPLIIYGRIVRRLSRKAQDMEADVHTEGSEVLSNIRTVQAYNAEDHHINRFEAKVEQVFAASKARMVARSGLTALAIFLVFSSVLGLLWVGSTQVAEGTISTGLLSQFVLYSVFAAMALGALTDVWGEVTQAAGAAERLDEFLKVQSQIKEPENPAILKGPVKGDITFQAVDFAYQDGTPVLKDLSFQVKAGQTVAIVGASGAGKSTLFQLLTRFYDVNSGAVEIDGIDVRDLALADLRAQMALVLQDPVLFDTSVAENIAYGLDDAPLEKIKQAAKLAAADEFIEKLADGYQTRLGEKGVLLSGGQRQRIAIARAFLKDAPILLLDEATSALDGESEAQIGVSLTELMKARTTLVIAHRLSTIRGADLILVMEDGAIVEQGTHDALIKKKGTYARLAKLQFQTAN